MDLTGTNFKEAEVISDIHFIYATDGAFPPKATDKSTIHLPGVSATVSELPFIAYATQTLQANTDFTDAKVMEQIRLS